MRRETIQEKRERIESQLLDVSSKIQSAYWMKDNSKLVPQYTAIETELLDLLTYLDEIADPITPAARRNALMKWLEVYIEDDDDDVFDALHGDDDYDVYAYDVEEEYDDYDVDGEDNVCQCCGTFFPASTQYLCITCRHALNYE